MQRSAIILCGGRSSRMGVDKALLPFGEVTMLEHISRTVATVIPPQRTVIIAAVDQDLPQMEAIVLHDSAEYQGPLPAISKGIEALASATDAVFVTGCDTPLLKASVIKHLFGLLRDFDCVVPQDAEQIHPLCAVYRSSILSNLRAFNGRSLREFISTLNASLICCDQLSAIDPDLNSFRNVNTQDDYLAALAVAGLSTP